MGEVYRARDAKLDRNAAIMVLPESFAHDPERIARFERERAVAVGRGDEAHTHESDLTCGQFPAYKPLALISKES